MSGKQWILQRLLGFHATHVHVRHAVYVSPTFMCRHFDAVSELRIITQLMLSDKSHPWTAAPYFVSKKKKKNGM